MGLLYLPQLPLTPDIPFQHLGFINFISQKNALSKCSHTPVSRHRHILGDCHSSHSRPSCVEKLSSVDHGSLGWQLGSWVHCSVTEICSCGSRLSWYPSFLKGFMVSIVKHELLGLTCLGMAWESSFLSNFQIGPEGGWLSW